MFQQRGESKRAPDLRDFKVRVLIDFDEEQIKPLSDHKIVVVPEEEVLLHRIVMHHSIARHLRLRGLVTIGRPLPKRPKSGTCEIFYAEVPNWTPQGIVFSPTDPLEIYVRNENEKHWLLAGSVIAFKRGRREDLVDDEPEREREE